MVLRKLFIIYSVYRREQRYTGVHDPRGLETRGQAEAEGGHVAPRGGARGLQPGQHRAATRDQDQDGVVVVDTVLLLLLLGHQTPEEESLQQEADTMHHHRAAQRQEHIARVQT